jgi:hypothetical protein
MRCLAIGFQRIERQNQYASLAAAVVLCLCPRTFAEIRTITSSPPGATVEMDGVVAENPPTASTIPADIFKSRML